MKQQDLPPYDRNNEKCVFWNNCCYVYGPHILGRIYFKKDGAWELISDDVRHYYVGPCDIPVMPYYDKRGYALFDTANTTDTYLLDCETGKMVYHGYFERGLALRLGMSDIHQKSCFIFKICLGNDDFQSYLLTDYQGEVVLDKRYVGKGKKISFLVTEPLKGYIYLIRFEDNTGKIGLLQYSSGECKEILEPEYDEIVLHNEIFDKKGERHAPVLKAVTKNRKTRFFNLEGNMISC